MINSPRRLKTKAQTCLINQIILMAFTKEYEYKKEVLPNGIVQVRRAEIVLEDGVELARKYSRYALVPGQNVLGEDASIQAICGAVWTPEVVAAYEASQTVDEVETEEEEA